MKRLLTLGLNLMLIFTILWSCQNPSETQDPESPAGKLSKGSEFLGEPEFTLMQGSGYLVAGIGLEESQPAVISYSLPADAAVKQAILYWTGGGTGNLTGDDNVNIEGNNGTSPVEITGNLIGGPTPFFPDNSTALRTPVYFSTFYKDITAWFNQSPGNLPSAITISGLDYLGVGYGPTFNENNGAYLFIVYDDGSPASIDIKDGLDVAWIRSSLVPPYGEDTKVTSEVTLSFRPEIFEREAKFFVFAATVDKLSGGGQLFQGDPRPNRIDITVGGVLYSYQDELGSFEGFSADVWEKTIPVPPGVAEATIRLFSTETAFTLTQPKNNANGPASLTWVAAGVSVPDILLGCTKSQGYWKTHSYFGPAPYDPVWENLLNDPYSNLGDYKPFFDSGYNYFEVTRMPSRGNAYFVLSPQYVAAVLNVYAGAYVPPAVQDALDNAYNLFVEFSPSQVGSMRGNNPVRKQFLKTAELLDDYNNGLLGVPYCN